MSEELKYVDKLDIPFLDIERTKSLIKNEIKYCLKSWDAGKEVQKQCFHLIGASGIGKTAIVSQICKELSKELPAEENFELIRVRAPVLDRGDFIIPFPIPSTEDGGETSFKMLYSDFMPKDKDSCGIFVIDEFSRADHSLQQLLWQVLNEYSIHLMEFPKKWFVVSIDNPDDEEYSMNMLEDSAGLRRMLHINIEVSVPKFLNYAIEKEYHPYVIEYIQNNPNHLYDNSSQKIGKVFANPASWEMVSDHLIKYESFSDGGIKESLEDLEILLGGLLNVNETRLFLDFVKDKKEISPEDVFKNYRVIKKDISKLIENKDNVSLGKLMTGFVNYLATYRPDYDVKQKNNIINFLCEMPIDISAIFVSTIDGFDKKSKEFDYFIMLHIKLMKNDKYKKNFYEEIIRLDKEKNK